MNANAKACDEEFIRYYGNADSPYSGNKNSLTVTLAPLKNLDNYRKESAAVQTGDTSELNTEQMGMSVSSTVWVWKGFTVKTVVDGGMFTIETKLDTFDENGKIPDGIFTIPDGMKIR